MLGAAYLVASTATAAAPSGATVAWRKDPDGNTLSVSER
jgi:surface antigen